MVTTPATRRPLARAAVAGTFVVAAGGLVSGCGISDRADAKTNWTAVSTPATASSTVSPSASAKREHPVDSPDVCGSGAGLPVMVISGSLTCNEALQVVRTNVAQVQAMQRERQPGGVGEWLCEPISGAAATAATHPLICSARESTVQIG
ncbi:hypothetical protein [Flexivirga meconopsidis]|uniref:hypothetical protein n=1 Tax=Flexivirga meconopsidis TaxID=2977121 RepID=UPI002240A939|nr:hypothetical protein [Flexivirga meconopsidis]